LMLMGIRVLIIQLYWFLKKDIKEQVGRVVYGKEGPSHSVRCKEIENDERITERIRCVAENKTRYETPMKQTVKMLKLKGNEPQTIAEVRAALSAMIEDIRSGDATVAEAESIKKEIDNLMKEIKAQMKSESQRTGLRSIYSW
jgi:hypothetical protein